MLILRLKCGYFWAGNAENRLFFTWPLALTAIQFHQVKFGVILKGAENGRGK